MAWNARDQLVLVERLGHVVISTEAEASDFVLECGLEVRMPILRPSPVGRSEDKVRGLASVLMTT